MGAYLKAVIAFLGAVADTVIVYADDGVITSNEWPLIVAGVATLVGVYFFPNTSTKNSADNSRY